MGIPRSVIGTRFTPITVMIERGRLAFFARAIGETDPIYTDVLAARAVGHPDLPVPPTFLFGMLMEGPNPFEWISELGIDLRYLLHANQSFNYFSMAYAGESLTFRPTITDVFEKRGGALEFICREIPVVRTGGEQVATLTETLVVRHPELEVVR